MLEKNQMVLQSRYLPMDVARDRVAALNLDIAFTAVIKVMNRWLNVRGTRRVGKIAALEAVPAGKQCS